MTSSLAIVRTPERAESMLSPIRRRVLGALREPGSATTVGEALGLPRQKVNYHLRALEAAGLVEHVEDRRKGNCTERIVRATAAHYLIDPSVLGELGARPEHVGDSFSSEHLAAVSARTVTELAELREGAARTGKRLPTFSLETGVRFATPAEKAEFLERLSATVTELVAHYHDGGAEGGRWFRLFVGAHPALTAPESIPVNEPEPS
jgi:DNA-binding transcriptional ArsR family regulator